MKTWPDPCGCKPGSRENGWHESRCEMCRQVERDIWRATMERVPSIIANLRSKR